MVTRTINAERLLVENYLDLLETAEDSLGVLLSKEEESVPFVPSKEAFKEYQEDKMQKEHANE